MYVMTDDDGRICATTDVEEYADGMGTFDFPDGFDFDSQSEYRIVDGELVHDPLPEPSEETVFKLKEQLRETDYVVIKMAEAQVTGAELPQEDSERYSSIIEQRAEWRKKINEIEKSLQQV